MHFFILNGPNLNLLGQREPDIYGKSSLQDIMEEVHTLFPRHNIEDFQSNSEGRLIDILQEKGFSCDGIVFNPAGYTHTSIALADTIRSIPCPVVEVHISNPEAREPYRKVSFLRDHCAHTISGEGPSCYEQGIRWLLRHLS